MESRSFKEDVAILGQSLSVVGRSNSLLTVPTVCVTPSSNCGSKENVVQDTMSDNGLHVPKEDGTICKARHRLSISALSSPHGWNGSSPSRTISISSLLTGGRRLSFSLPISMRRTSWSVSHAHLQHAIFWLATLIMPPSALHRVKNEPATFINQINTMIH